MTDEELTGFDMIDDWRSCAIAMIQRIKQELKDKRTWPDTDLSREWAITSALED